MRGTQKTMSRAVRATELRQITKIGRDKLMKWPPFFIALMSRHLTKFGSSHRLADLCSYLSFSHRDESRGMDHMARLIFDIAGLEKKVRVKSLRQRKKGTLTTKKIVRIHDIDHAIEQEKKQV